MPPPRAGMFLPFQGERQTSIRVICIFGVSILHFTRLFVGEAITSRFPEAFLDVAVVLGKLSRVVAVLCGYLVPDPSDFVEFAMS